ncbi:MAG: pilus assembly protein [Gemmataceae bacterium]|nr:pilus assembly protein [Gemmataceae bacterium]
MTATQRKPVWSSGRRRGAAAAELAVVLPVLMLIVVGALDFGRFAHSHIAVTNAARAGAGVGSANPPTVPTLGTWKAQVTQAVHDEMAQLGTPSTVTVSDPYTDEGRTLFKVTVEYPFSTVVAWPGIPGSLTLRHTVVMEIQD